MMLSLLFLSAGLTLSALDASATCPNFSGDYRGTTVVQSADQPMTYPSSMRIKQKGCEEISIGVEDMEGVDEYPLGSVKKTDRVNPADALDVTTTLDSGYFSQGKLYLLRTVSFSRDAKVAHQSLTTLSRNRRGKLRTEAQLVSTQGGVAPRIIFTQK